MNQSQTMPAVNQEPSTLAVIIPMYNEERGAERCVRAMCEVLKRKLPSSRLFVVNDGSRDNTKMILQSLANEGLPFSLVSYDQNQGYGAALITGARSAAEMGFDFGLFMDSDLTNDPELIPQFHKAIQGNVDVVKASRYIPTGGMSGVPMYRQMISRYGNVIASTLFNIGVRDCTNGFRAVRLSMLKDLSLKERGFASIMEELYHLKKLGARFKELPYTLTSRLDDQDGSKFRYTWRTFYNYFKYCVKAALVTGNKQEI